MRRHTASFTGLLGFSAAAFLLFAPGMYAQTELHAEKQILLEARNRTEVIRRGPDGALYVLHRSVKPPSAIWKSNAARSAMQPVLSADSEPSPFRFPKDFAVDRAGNVVVVDVGSPEPGSPTIKIFSSDGKLTGSIAVERPESVGVLSDGRILVSGRGERGVPLEHLISVFDRRGKLVGTIGEPAKADEDSKILNLGYIAVDDQDNIYFAFRYLLTPTVRKYTSDGELVAEWHPQGALMDQAAARARAIYEKRDADGRHGWTPVFTAASFDADGKSLWVASVRYLFELDGSGSTIQSWELSGPTGRPVDVHGLVVERDSLYTVGVLSGALEFAKPK